MPSPRNLQTTIPYSFLYLISDLMRRTRCNLPGGALGLGFYNIGLNINQSNGSG